MSRLPSRLELCLLALMACAPATTQTDSAAAGGDGGADGGDGAAGDGGDGGDGSDGGDGGQATDSGAPVESVPGQADEGVRNRDCEGLYDPDALHQFELDMPSSSWSGLLGDFASGNKNYHPATFTWGEESREVQVRLKGNPNFSWLGEKLQFVISFNEDDNDARFHGIRKISLDSTWYEPTMLRDRLAWAILRDVEGIPAACANSARLDINGEYYGLYSNIEYLDREWVEATFGKEHADSTLWKYGTEAKTNEDAADSTLVARFFNSNTVSQLQDLGDLDQWLLVWAGEAVLGDDDGYWCCAHNFYIYEHPTRDLLMVPWDLDDLFDVTPYNLDPIEGYDNPRGLFNQRPFTVLAGDDVYGPRYVDAVETVTNSLDAAAWNAKIDTWAAQIGPSLAEDPHRSIGVEEHEQSIVRLKDYLSAREKYLRSWVDCARGGSTDADSDGSDVCADPDDTNAEIHPGASEVCNGLDDDANGIIDDDPACDDCARHDFGEGHFLYCSTPRTWAAAQANCEAQGANLSFPHDTPEYYLFYWYTWPVFEGWWIGATDLAQEGTWVDPNGASVAQWDYWASSQPNGGTDQNCASWHPSYAGWVDLDCAEEHPSVCQLDDQG